MIRFAAAGFLLIAGSAQDDAARSRQAGETSFAQLVVQQRIVVRPPERPAGGVAASSRVVQWRETSGPRCLATRDIAGANVAESSIDFVLRDRRRIRARLNRRCQGLNYYRGFYLNQSSDGRICADRDTVRSRMGGECGIAEFRSLQPVAAARSPRR